MTDVQKTFLRDSHLQLCLLRHHDRREREEVGKYKDNTLPVLRMGGEQNSKTTGRGIHVKGLVALPLPKKLQKSLKSAKIKIEN